METETLTFDFGTTPEKVIRERIANVIEGGVEWHLVSADLDDASSHKIFAADDLITVLRALEWTGDEATGELPSDERDKFRRLRIEILSALGIKEG